MEPRNPEKEGDTEISGPKSGWEVEIDWEKGDEAPPSSIKVGWVGNGELEFPDLAQQTALKKSQVTWSPGLSKKSVTEDAEQRDAEQTRRQRLPLVGRFY